jgi:cyclic nucleotide gated channel
MKEVQTHCWCCLHVKKISGAWWYILSVQRQEACWRSACNSENSIGCENDFFDCRRVDEPPRLNWLHSTNVTNLCNPSATFYQYGIYANAVSSNVIGSAFFNKYFYGLWWGLQQLRYL